MEGIDQATTRRDYSEERPSASDRVLPSQELEDRLADELARAHRYSRPLSIVEISLDGLDPAHRGAAATLVSQHVRRQDALGWSEGSRIIAVLPETSSEGAAALAQRLVGALSAVAVGARAATCTYPVDGTEIDVLLGRLSGILASDAARQITLSTQLTRGSGPSSVRPFRPIEEEVRELERARMKEALEAAGG